MSNAADTGGALQQNLVDAGCSPETVRQCLVLARKQDQSELMQVLSRHRRVLLDSLHQSEKRIDCLDYLVYMLGKENKYKQPSGEMQHGKVDFDPRVG